MRKNEESLPKKEIITVYHMDFVVLLHRRAVKTTLRAHSGVNENGAMGVRYPLKITLEGVFQ